MPPSDDVIWRIEALLLFSDEIALVRCDDLRALLALAKRPSEPSEKMRLRVARAIERAIRDKELDSYGDEIDHDESSDWGVYLADAALAALQNTAQIEEKG